MTITQTIDRRGFMKSAAAGALVIAVPFLTMTGADAETRGGSLGHYLTVRPDGKIDLVVPTFEIGQGAHTSLAQILADELEARWEDVVIHSAMLNPALNVPAYGQQTVAGSFSVRVFYQPLRQAAASAREMLRTAAANEWNVPEQEVSIADSMATHKATQRALHFSDLVQAAAKLDVPENPPLKDKPSIIGKSVTRKDIPGKVDGSATYGIDIRVPDMVYAAIRQAPVFGAEVVSVDRSALDGMRGIIDVVEIPSAFLVVADTFWSAKKGVDALEVTFAATEFDAISTADIIAAQNAQLDRDDGGVAINDGDAWKAIAEARSSDSDKVLSSDYTVPFLCHGTMEPMNATAYVNGDRCQVWAPTQGITTATKVAAAAAGVPEENVEVYAIFAGGGFGRKYENDFIDQAVRASKAVGRPVQLIWTREQDVQHDFYRPSVSARMTASVKSDGSVDAFAMRLAGQSVIEHTYGIPYFDNRVDPVTMLDIETQTGSAPGKVQQYTIPNTRAEYLHQPTHVPVGYWRSVGASHNGFFIESFVDELAHKAGADPYEFRRNLLRNSPRGLAVLDRVAKEAGWGTELAPGHFQGIAFSEAVGSIVAFVAEVSMNDGEPKVHKITVAIDCGILINPDTAKAQMMGGTIMGLGSALYEEVNIEEGRAAHENFYDYHIIGMEETPEIDVHLIDSQETPGGVGEAPGPGVVPAVTNAIFAASGNRIRSLPIMSNLA
ncbi:MAG: molybdopterin cofactor-binding domain-containing protein [Pseudomonadota bacterium]